MVMFAAPSANHLSRWYIYIGEPPEAYVYRISLTNDSGWPHIGGGSSLFTVG
jgi:hypothetical protein